MPERKETEQSLETLEEVQKRERRAALERASHDLTKHTEEPANGLDLSERMEGRSYGEQSNQPD